jgi:Ca-activated chloride channel family protein
MYKFQHINDLWWLLSIPICIGFYYLYLINRQKKISQLGNAQMINSLMPSYSKKLAFTKLIFILASILCIVISLANLQTISSTQKVTRKGVDVMIALDVSNSMLANDIQPSRLEKAKQLVATLTDKISNNRVGLVLFAGKSYTSVPLTADINAVKMNLSIADPSMIASQGTAISEAIETCINSFNKKETSYKTIILISDGEDHEEAAITKANKAMEQGIVIQTVGVGSPEGTTIIDPQTQEIKTDENGENIISKLNEKELQTIADATEGTYNYLQNTEDIASQLANEINSVEQKNVGDSIYTSYNSYFQYFLLIAILLLIIEYFMPSIRVPKKVAGAVLLLILFLFSNNNIKAQTADVNMYNGNKKYKQGHFEEATKLYTKAFEAKKNREVQYNLGNALYLNNDIENAQKQYEQAATFALNNTLRAEAAHNMGNTFLDQKKYKEAIEWYKKALRENPTSKNSKYNLAYAQQKLNQENKQKEQDKKEDKKEDKKKEEEEKKKEEQQKKDEQKSPEEKKQEEEKRKQDEQQKKDEQKKKEEQSNDKPKPMPSKLTKQQAEQLLNALNQEEKKLKEKKEKQKGVPIRLQKDW